MSVSQFLVERADQVNEALESMMRTRKNVIPDRLQEAMNYSLLAPGKRIRPTLMLECYAACDGHEEMMSAALSVECMHAYSLIHDDLPCMDDDNLRRGQPTCHKKFGEATAVLTADALQALGFELLTESTASNRIRCELIHKMSIAAGAQGMVGGQMLDMFSTEANIGNVLDVERIHIHKTGALLCYCCEAGALLATTDESRINACIRFGRAVGLLFQIADDILDATATSSELGKSTGKDASQHKATYVSVLGIEKASELAGEMLELALSALEPLGSQGARLRQLACYILERRQ